MVHDKVLLNQSIIRDLRDPTTLSINYNICLHIFSCKNIFKCKIQSVHYTKSPKDVRKLALYNSTSGLTCKSIANYDWNDILRTNFLNTIFKLFHNIMSVFHFSLSIYGVQEHRATFSDCHEINQRSSLYIRPPITSNRDPFFASMWP